MSIACNTSPTTNANNANKHNPTGDRRGYFAQGRTRRAGGRAPQFQSFLHTRQGKSQCCSAESLGVRQPGAGWTGDSGFVNAEMIKKRIGGNDAADLVLVCGPPRMIEFVNAQLKGRIILSMRRCQFNFRWFAALDYRPEQVFNY